MIIMYCSPKSQTSSVRLIFFTAVSTLLMSCSTEIHGRNRQPPLLSGDPQLGYSTIEQQIRPDPFSHLESWPFLTSSPALPISIRYQRPAQEDLALRTLRHLEHTWRVHTEELGFRPPIAYAPDNSGRFTAFVWPGFGLTLAIAANRSPLNSWESFESYLIVDPGASGGEQDLPDTLAFEFHQAVIMAYAPWAPPTFMAASATYITDLVNDESNYYLRILHAFQANPQRGLGFDDRFQSFYAHGVSLYLFFLEQRHFPDNPRFLAELWEASKGPRTAGSIYTPPIRTINPSWVDALEMILPLNVSFNDTLAEFARWRYYTGRREVGAHFSEASLFSDDLAVATSSISVNRPRQYQSELFATGSEYVQLTRSNRTDPILSFQLDGDRLMEWIIQLVPDPQGLADGVFVTGDQLDFGDLNQVTLIITAAPILPFDPTTDEQITHSFEFSIGH